MANINRDEIVKTAGYLGAGLLVAGYIRYSVQEVMGTLNGSIIIAGAVLLLASLAYNFRTILAYSRTRSGRLGANTGVLTIAFVAILALINFLGYRHHKRIDLTTEKLYSLSDQSKKIAAGLQKDVKVVKFDKSDDQELKDLMQEYRNFGSHITYERIDPQTKPEIAKQYGVGHMGEVVIACGNHTQRPADSGEQTITNAIIKVTRDTVKTVCFVEGHGERSLSSNDREGYEAADKFLKDETYETRKINLVSSNQVPADCSVLVIAGPKKGYLPEEAAMVGKYLDGGGKALFLLDPDTEPNLNDVLASWNVEVGNDIVIDTSGVGRLTGSPAIPLVTKYGSHPVTKEMDDSMTFFPLVRSVSSGKSSGGSVSNTELLKTSDQSWAATDLKGDLSTFHAGRDKKGPISLGVAATKSLGEKEARLVVIGDSDFATNQAIGLVRNGDLFLNAINWLAQDEDMISVRPKAPTNRQVTMTASQQNFLFWLTLALMPGAVIASGVYLWWKRR
jgi:ABC-type uncharacterized transport system involved in gliding motility auxiliary subunit